MTRSFVAGGASPRIVEEISFLASAVTPRKNASMTKAMVSLVLGLAVAPGCKTSTHAEAKIQAEQRWSEVRGQVKFQLARQQFERAHFEDAIKTLEETLALDPKSAAGYALLAKANLELGRPSTANEILAVAAKRGCASAELHYLGGVVLELRDDLPGALAEFEKACSLDPSEAGYLVARVETLVALDRAKEALQLIDRHVHAFDDDAAVLMLGGRIALMLGDLDGALERLQDPALRPADSRIATEELGALLAAKGHHHEAIRLLGPLCEGVDDCRLSATGQRVLAESHLAVGDADLALRVLSQFPFAELKDSAAHLLTARTALAAGQFMLALSSLESARGQSGDEVEIRLLLGTTHWKRGDFGGAEAVLEDLLKAAPSDVEAWCLLGEVLHDSGRTAEAMEALGRAMELEPGNRWATDRLKQIEASGRSENGAEKKF